jgi:hypothetical protein
MTDLNEIAATIENLPSVLATLLAPIDPAVLARPPSDGEWSVHQVIGHLITGDGPAFRNRVAAIIAGEPEIAPFDPGTALDARDFDQVALGELLTELTAEREQSAAYLRTLRPVDLLTTSAYGRHGSLAAGDFVLEWPFHDHDHLQQILEILKRAHLPAMTEPMRRALTPN